MPIFRSKKLRCSLRPASLSLQKMNYTRLGRSGLRVSRLCLGTMNFGPVTSEEDSFVIVDKALEFGVNFFDTADVYGWKVGEGITEQIVGRGGRRGNKDFEKRVESKREQLEKYGALCRDLGESPADIGIAWLLQNRAVAAPIIGPRTVEQLTGSLHALEISLSAETLASLNTIWPGPSGPAPEAYAW